jgi:hypothetical protein
MWQSYFTAQYTVHRTDEQHAMPSHELQSALITVEFSKMYAKYIMLWVVGWIERVQKKKREVLWNWSLQVDEEQRKRMWRALHSPVWEALKVNRSSEFRVRDSKNYDSKRHSQAFTPLCLQESAEAWNQTWWQTQPLRFCQFNAEQNWWWWWNFSTPDLFHRRSDFSHEWVL